MPEQNSFSKIQYSQLNSRQRENYNFQKISGILADYGFVTMRLNDDWQGADFIAQHISGSFLKVQLKGRLEINKKYIGKEIWMCFPALDGNGCYLFSHDEVKDWLLKNRKVEVSKSWSQSGVYSWGKPNALIKDFLEVHRLQ